MTNVPCPFRLQRVSLWMKGGLWSALSVVFFVQQLPTFQNVPELYTLFAPLALVIVLGVIVVRSMRRA